MLVFSPLPSIFNVMFPLHSLYVFPFFLNACSRLDNVNIYSADVDVVVPFDRFFVNSVVSIPSIAILIFSAFKFPVTVLE